MNTYSIHIHDNKKKFPEIFLNICFLELSEENEFESTTVNKLSEFIALGQETNGTI